MLQTIQPSLARSIVDDAVGTPPNGFGQIKYLLDRGQDVSILNWADSLSNSSAAPREFAFCLADLIATHPAAPRVEVETWNTASSTFAPATVEHAGNGGPTVRIRNFAVPGAALHYGLGTLWTGAGLAYEAPDCLVVCQGHNHVTGTTSQIVTGEFIAAVEFFRLHNPHVPVVAISQNPRSNTSTMDLAHAGWTLLEARREVALADAFSHYEAAGRPADWYQSGDPVHPSDAGFEGAFVPALRDLWDASPTRPATSPISLLTGLPAALNLIDNGSFTSFEGSVPSGWTAAAGVTAEADTAMRRDPSLPHSLKLTCTSGYGWLSHDIATFEALRGREVSLIGWVRRPAGGPGTAGRMSVQTSSQASGTGIYSTRAYDTNQEERWVPWCLSGVPVPADCTRLRVLLYHDTDASPSPHIVHFDAVSLVPGPLPRGL